MHKTTSARLDQPRSHSMAMRWLLTGGLVVTASTLGLGSARAEQAQAHGSTHGPVVAATKPAHAPAGSGAPTTASVSDTPDAQTLAAAMQVQALVLQAQARQKDTAHASPKPAHNPAHGSGPASATAHTAALAHSPDLHSSAPKPSSRAYIRAKASALAGRTEPARAATAAGHAGGEAHWTYDGETGPQNWSQLKPEYETCATGQRQSPIHIEEGATLPGPAEPLLFNYQASTGSVVNNGHTIQVDVEGDNTLAVRGSVYKLVQFHFHHPAEEKVNYKGFSMVVHLVHKNAAGQLAVLAVLMDPGASSPLVEKVWTHMPLDVADRVKLPVGLINLVELLPQDQRYYQFIGSLTTPPCTEGVLWMVLKQPMTLSRSQLRLFSQLFPNNARPAQAVNNRIVREAM